MKKKSVLALLLAVLLLLAPISTFAEADIWSPVEESDPDALFSDQIDTESVIRELQKHFHADSDLTGELKEKLKENFSDDEYVTLIVELNGEAGLEAANRRGVAFDEMHDAQQLEQNTIAAQEDFLARLREKGIPFEIKQHYTAVLNAVAIEVKVADIDGLAEISPVKGVYYSNTYEAPKEVTSRLRYSHEMIGDEEVWNSGFKGEGQVVAVLDTGVDHTHQDLQLISDLSAAKLNEEKVNALIAELGMKGRYLSTKVPYGYNYFDDNHDVKDSSLEASMHGQHVTGIVAANGEIKGVAPEAQILAMNVFGNDPLFSSTQDYIYLKAFDDALKLGADVINMSLGSPADFNN